MSLSPPLSFFARLPLLKKSGWREQAAALGHRLLEAEMGRFGLWLVVFLGAGDALYFALPREPPSWAGFFPLLTFPFLFLLRRRPFLRAAALSLFVFALGFAAAQWAALRAPPLSRFPSRVVHVSGEVAGFEPLAEGGRILLAAPEIDGAPPLPRMLRLRLEGEAAPLVMGAHIRLRTYLMPPPGPAYPGAWDLRRDDFFAGIGGYGRILGPLEVLAAAPAASRPHFIETLRQRIAARIGRVLPGEEGAIAVTLLAGYARAIPEADRLAFRDAGLAHLLAIAGLHMGIVMGFVFWAVRFLLTCAEWPALHLPVQPLAALAALAFGGFYMLITGAHVPIQRSFAMAVLLTLALLLGRRAVSLRGWAIAAAVILLLRPAELLGVSFEMSFAAVLALISGYEAWGRALFRLPSAFLRHVAMLVLTSLLAGLASAPFAASRFGQIQLYFILGNLLAVPLAAFWVMPWGVAALALMPFGGESLALRPMGFGIEGLLAIARGVSALPAARIPVPALPAGALAVVALGLLWLCLWRSRLRWAGLPLIGLGLIAPLFSPPADLLVASEGHLLALRGREGAYLTESGRGGSFLRAAWANYWGISTFRSFSEAPPDLLSCTAEACLLHPRAGLTLLFLPPRLSRRVMPGEPPSATAVPFACAEVALVIAFRESPLCADRPHLDRMALASAGPAALWAGPEGTFTLRFAGEEARERRWNRLLPWREESQPDTLPLAPAETLP